MVRESYLRVRKFSLKLQKLPILGRYKFAKWRMLRNFSEHLERLVFLDEETGAFHAKWNIPLWSRLLLLNFARDKLGRLIKFEGRAPPIELEMLRTELKHKFAFNLHLDRVSPFYEMTPDEIMALSEERLYELFEGVGYPRAMWEEWEEIVERVWEMIRLTVFVSAEG